MNINREGSKPYLFEALPDRDATIERTHFATLPMLFNSLYSEVKSINPEILTHYLSDLFIHDRDRAENLKEGEREQFVLNPCGSHFLSRWMERELREGPILHSQNLLIEIRREVNREVYSTKSPNGIERQREFSYRILGILERGFEIQENRGSLSIYREKIPVLRLKEERVSVRATMYETLSDGESLYQNRPTAIEIFDLPIAYSDKRLLSEISERFGFEYRELEIDSAGDENLFGVNVVSDGVLDPVFTIQKEEVSK